MNLFLLAANNKFNYNSNFEESFTYTFCSACNSKFQQLKSKNKITNNKLGALNIPSKESEKNLSSGESTIKEDNVNEEEDSIEEDSIEKNSIKQDNIEEDSIEKDDIEEIKIQVIVKNKNIKAPTAKSLTIQPVNYENVVEKINLVV